MREEKTTIDSRPPWMAMVVCGLLLAPSVAWLWLDCHVWDWDPAEYGYFAIDLWRSLWTESRLWPWLFFHAVGPKAPTLIWIGQFMLPLRHVLGGAGNLFNFINLAFQWGSLFLLWRCAHQVTGKKWGAYVLCIWLAGMPLFVGMSQDFLTEPMQLFAVLFVWFIALSGSEWSVSKRLAFLLWGGAWVLGAKASTPAYCVVPGVYSLYWLGKSIRRKQWGLNRWNGLGMATGAFHLGVIAAWYVLNREEAVQKVMDASVGDAAYHFGYKDTFSNKMVYWLGSLGQSLTLRAMAPLLIFVGVVLVCALVWMAWRKRDGIRWRGGAARVFVLSALQVLIALVVLAVNISTPIRYVYAILPSFLLMLAPGLGGGGGVFPRRVALYGMGIWFAGSQLLFLGLVSSAEVESARHWTCPERNPSQINQIKHVITRLNTREYDGVYHLCGADFSWFSGSTLNYYAALDSLDSGHRTQFGRLGHFLSEVEPAWARVHGQLGSYLAGSDDLMNGRTDRHGQVSMEILNRIKADPRFVKEATPELPDLVLYRNRTRGARGKELGAEP